MTLTPSESAERGRAARKECPRSAHAVWEPPRRRRNPVRLLEEQARPRVGELVPIRHGRMAASPFAFFRGAAYVMASDLASTPRSGFDVQLCGDAHLSNFGGFAAPDRRLVFDLNDFDETHPGPWEWDVKRLAASLAVAGRQSEFGPAARRRVVTAAVGRYRQGMRDLAAMPNLDVWYARFDVDELFARFRERVSARDLRRAERNLAKARRKDRTRAFAKLTERVNGTVRLIGDPPLIVPARDLFTEHDAEEVQRGLEGVFAAYSETLPAHIRHLVGSYRFVDAARKVVGVGSVGTRAWIALLLGRDDRDPLFLQIKEAEASVLERFTAPSAFEHSGQRVVEGQRLMQAAGDIMLGWVRATGVDGVDRDFYVRQLWDWKLSAVVDAMSPGALATYGEMCGWTLARAHARSGDRVAIAAYLGSGARFDEALADFAEAYADQNELDHTAFVQAIEDGRLQTETGV